MSLGYPQLTIFQVRSNEKFDQQGDKYICFTLKHVHFIEGDALNLVEL